MRGLKILIAAVVVAGTSPAPAVGADDEDVIEYRRHIMNSLNEQAAMLGQIVSTAIPNDNVITHLDALALLASTALESFEAEVPGGKARPEVWSDWDDFSTRMNEFAEKTSEAARLAKENGKENALANILDVLSCKSCHDVYRDEPE
jgi:cytochrome c556